MSNECIGKTIKKKIQKMEKSKHNRLNVGRIAL